MRYVLSKLGQDLVAAFLSPGSVVEIAVFSRKEQKGGLSKMLDEIQHFNHVVYMNTLIKVIGTIHDDCCRLIHSSKVFLGEEATMYGCDP